MNAYYKIGKSTEKKSINIEFGHGVTVTRWKSSRKFAVWENEELLACCEYLKGAKAVAGRLVGLLNATTGQASCSMVAE